MDEQTAAREIDAQQDAEAPPVNRLAVAFVQENLGREVPSKGEKTALKHFANNRASAGDEAQIWHTLVKMHHWA
jgi:hypothetical protein